MTMVTSGFAFVNFFNLLNQRRNVFKGRDGTYSDIKILIVASVFLYFTSPIIALRSRHDMQRDFQFNVRWPSNLPVENQYPECKGNLV